MSSTTQPSSPVVRCLVKASTCSTLFLVEKSYTFGFVETWKWARMIRPQAGIRQPRRVFSLNLCSLNIKFRPPTSEDKLTYTSSYHTGLIKFIGRLQTLNEKLILCLNSNKKIASKWETLIKKFSFGVAKKKISFAEKIGFWVIFRRLLLLFDWLNICQQAVEAKNWDKQTN